MKFYHNFKYQYTQFFNSLEDCISDAKKQKRLVSIIWQVKEKRGEHWPVKLLLHTPNKVYQYSKKHAINKGFKSVTDCKFQMLLFKDKNIV